MDEPPRMEVRTTGCYKAGGMGAPRLQKMLPTVGLPSLWTPISCQAPLAKPMDLQPAAARPLIQSGERWGQGMGDASETARAQPWASSPRTTVQWLTDGFL